MHQAPPEYPEACRRSRRIVRGHRDAWQPAIMQGQFQFNCQLGFQLAIGVGPS
jgi:hypothetical protein